MKKKKEAKKEKEVANEDEQKLTYPKRPKRVEMTREEIIKRMEDFPKRAPKIIAAIRRAREAD